MGSSRPGPNGRSRRTTCGRESPPHCEGGTRGRLSPSPPSTSYQDASLAGPVSSRSTSRTAAWKSVRLGSGSRGVGQPSTPRRSFSCSVTPSRPWAASGSSSRQTPRTSSRGPPCGAIWAHEEGTLRNYRLGVDGRPRQIVIYSIVDSEWAAVKAYLQELLDRPR